MCIRASPKAWASTIAPAGVTCIRQKVRQQDAAGDVALGRVGQADAPDPDPARGRAAYVTWIYPYQGGLYELTLYAQGRPKPGDGSAFCPWRTYS